VAVRVEQMTAVMLDQLVVGSQITDAVDVHLPVIDLDTKHHYVPSATPGHAHLYLDIAMPWRKYEKILRALADADVIGWPEYVRALDRHGTFVRPPGAIHIVEHHRMAPLLFLWIFVRLWFRAGRRELWRELKRVSPAK
jgi:hypothetical protein